MTDAGCSRQRRNPAVAGLLVAILASTWSCSEGTAPLGGPADPQQELGPAIVSNPVASVALRTSTRPAVLAPSVAYVSLPPGAFPTGVTATITNQRTSLGLTTNLLDGGLDPVAIPAEAGDSLSFAIDTGGPDPARFVQVVPHFVRVRVVRTDPPSGKRDVPLNLRIRVIFSEPVIPATVANGAVRLEQAGSVVSGTVAVAANGLETSFQPDADLLPETDYTIVVSDGVEDTDGAGLAVPVRAEFTTGSASGSAVGLRFEWQPTNTLAGLTQRSAVVVVATDASGKPATGFTGEISLTIGSNPGNGSLSSTAKRSGPFTAFTDLRIDRAGDGYTLVASSDGLNTAASSTFDVVPPTDLLAIASDGIVLMSADGRGAARLQPWQQAADLSWSPDGTRLAFAWPGTTQRSTIYVMNADGTAATALGAGSSPAWSPDGSRIAFARLGEGDSSSAIWIMNPDGSDAVRLTNEPAYDIDPAWAPDGRSLAFGRMATVDWFDGYRAIWIMNVDGSDVVRMTSQWGVANDPAWSPDGSRIAFTDWSYVDHRTDIYVMRPDGSGISNLTANHARSTSRDPAWSPDGRRIAFAARSDSDFPDQVYVMNADGSGVALLGPGKDGRGYVSSSLSPEWSPR